MHHRCKSLGSIVLITLAISLFLPGSLSLAADPILIAETTRFGSTSELEGDITCGKNTGGLHTYLKTAKFRIYICSDPQDPTFPRFYRGFSAPGKLNLSLRADGYDPRQGRYLIFENGGYQYILDSGNSTTQVAQLIVKAPDGKILSEEIASVYLNSPMLQQDNAPEFGCAADESQFIDAETQHFQVYICGGDLPHTYVGIVKQNGSSIRLHLQSYQAQGEQFVAVNGTTRYILTPQHLKVTEGFKVLVDEPITRWN
jgi:hypothetical protein